MPEFAKGTSYDDVVAGVARGGLGGNQGLAVAFVRTAAGSLCPKCVSALP